MEISPPVGNRMAESKSLYEDKSCSGYCEREKIGEGESVICHHDCHGKVVYKTEQ
jgi:hypothetical protein